MKVLLNGGPRDGEEVDIPAGLTPPLVTIDPLTEDPPYTLFMDDDPVPTVSRLSVTNYYPHKLRHPGLSFPVVLWVAEGCDPTIYARKRIL